MNRLLVSAGVFAMLAACADNFGNAQLRFGTLEVDATGTVGAVRAIPDPAFESGFSFSAYEFPNMRSSLKVLAGAYDIEYLCDRNRGEKKQRTRVHVSRGTSTPMIKLC